MNKRRTVTCIGELIADLYSADAANPQAFRLCAGGAPANVAVGLARLGVRSAFAGRVGDDLFGRFLVGELRKARVDARGVVFDAGHKTRLALITLDSSGGREFEFWEKHPADEQLKRSDIDRGALRASAIVHLSSFLLLSEPSRSAAHSIARACSRSGCVVSFDPNLRFSLWSSPAAARRETLEMASFSRILRLNAEEAYFLTRKRDLESAARELRSFGPSLVVITGGEVGCYLRSGAAAAFVDGFPVRALDTTGCGDGFLAGLLAAVSRSRTGPEDLNERELRSLGRFANAAGALTALKKGVFPALPTLANVRSFLKARP